MHVKSIFQEEKIKIVGLFSEAISHNPMPKAKLLDCPVHPPLREFGEVVGLQQPVEGLLPLIGMDELVELRDPIGRGGRIKRECDNKAGC